MPIGPEFADSTPAEILSNYGYKFEFLPDDEVIDLLQQQEVSNLNAIPVFMHIWKNDGSNEYMGIYSLIGALQSLEYYDVIKKQPGADKNNPKLKNKGIKSD